MAQVNKRYIVGVVFGKVNCHLNPGPKWQILCFKPILSAIFVG